MALVGDGAKKVSSLEYQQSISLLSFRLDGGKVKLGKWAKKSRRFQDIRENEGEVSSFTLRLEDMEWKALG